MSARSLVLVLSIASLTVLSMGFGVLTAHPTGAVRAAPPPEHRASAPTLGPTSVAPPVAERRAYENRILATAKADHIPMAAVSLPNLLGQAKISDGVVSPLTTVAPAPMGIGTFGVLNTSGTAVPYTIETTSWEGSITLGSVNTFWLDNDGALSTTGTDNTFGVQLNTVTTNSTVGNQSSYSFWTQNVLYWNLIPGYVTFLDNVWNFSSPAIALTQGTIYAGNGTPVYPEYYFDFGPSYPVTLPATVHLFLNSSTTSLGGIGYTTIRFGYEIVNASSGLTEEQGIYDTVLFNSTLPIGSVPSSPFLVSGSQITPTGYLLYDAEIMIGGPGGGTTTSVYGINASESLQYYDSGLGTYVNPPSAWNVGTDTGETSEGIAETYTSPGTVQVTAGPSIPAPLWNATPGGNVGKATFVGPLSPSNAFVFFTAGSGFNTSLAAWAPTQTASSVDYLLPPGTYTVDAMLSDYAPVQTTVTVHNGGVANLHLVLHRDGSKGVYTPLFAWNNGQLAAISTGGTGTAFNPYRLFNNPASGGLNPVFAEMNVFFYPVFPGVLLAGTTAHVDLTHPSLMGVTYPALYDGALAFHGLPLTNNLAFQIYEASNVTIWGAHGITGWFFFQDYGPTGLLPLANVVLFGGSHDLIGDSTFVSQGSSLLLADINPALPSGNVVWGNTFVNSTVLSPTMYPGNGVFNGPPIGIFAFEAGDLIYNNYVATSITAYAPNQNFYFGFGQLNVENWNLSMVEPAGFFTVFNGHLLGGTIVHSAYQGGNFWIDYIPGSPLPYDEYGFIASGGDYFPLPITAYAVVFVLVPGHGYTPGPRVWSATVNGVTETSGFPVLVFYEVPGTYTYTDTLVSGAGTISPSSGTVSVVSHSVVVVLTIT
jgi:thermopsin